MRRLTSIAAAAILAQPALAHDSLNDYPTVARADYIFACMASNGQTREVLERCSCSIDVIASILSYDDYVAAETVIRTTQVTGERVAAFRGSARHKAMLSNLRRAQAEADIICFGGG
ncbi:MAG: hypothetical protein AAF526_09350 [Pseudomonadota bacterium]